MNSRAPDWSDSPDWAQYLAQDADGSWWWHELEPQPPLDCQPQSWWSRGQKQRAVGGWRQSLQKRRDWAKEIQELPKETDDGR